MVPIAGILSVKLRLSFGYASVTLRLSRAGKSGLKSWVSTAGANEIAEKAFAWEGKVDIKGCAEKAVRPFVTTVIG